MSNINRVSTAPPKEPLLREMIHILGLLESVEALEQVINYILELSKAVYLSLSLPAPLQLLARLIQGAHGMLLLQVDLLHGSFLPTPLGVRYMRNLLDDFKPQGVSLKLALPARAPSISLFPIQRLN
jgi:hypothetical protein